MSNLNFKNEWTQPLFRLFSVFSIKQYNFHNNVKNVHQVSGSGIQTHNLSIMSLLP